MNASPSLRSALVALALTAGAWGCAAPRPVPAATASAPAPAPGSGATLHISPEKVLAPVNREVLVGFNIANMMQIADFAEDLQTIGAAHFRFPGGNIGDENDLTEHALDFLAANLGLLKSQAPVMIQTRVFQGGMSKDPARNRPEDAADAVRWARARGIKVPIWEIGNEPDLFAVTRGDASWTTEKYCEVFRAQAKAIKAVDPQARVAGPAVSGAVPVRDVFLEKFVEKCGDVLDVLTWHIYPTDGTMDDARAFDTASQVDDTVARFKALLADPKRNPLGHGRKVTLGVTEYALSWYTNRARHLADIQNALWSAEVALRLDEQGAEVAHYFAFQGIVNHGLLDMSGIRRPTYYGFGLLGRLEGQLVAASASDPLLWTHAAIHGKQLDVLVTNRSPAARALATAVPGYALERAEWFDAAIADKEQPLAQARPAPSLSLGPNAMMHLVYRAQ